MHSYTDKRALGESSTVNELSNDMQFMENKWSHSEKNLKMGWSVTSTSATRISNQLHFTL